MLGSRFLWSKDSLAGYLIFFVWGGSAIIGPRSDKFTEKKCSYFLLITGSVLIESRNGKKILNIEHGLGAGFLLGWKLADHVLQLKHVGSVGRGSAAKSCGFLLDLGQIGHQSLPPLVQILYHPLHAFLIAGGIYSPVNIGNLPLDSKSLQV